MFTGLNLSWFRSLLKTLSVASNTAPCFHLLPSPYFKWVSIHIIHIVSPFFLIFHGFWKSQGGGAGPRGLLLGPGATGLGADEAHGRYGRGAAGAADAAVVAGSQWEGVAEDGLKMGKMVRNSRNGGIKFYNLYNFIYKTAVLDLNERRWNWLELGEEMGWEWR